MVDIKSAVTEWNDELKHSWTTISVNREYYIDTEVYSICVKRMPNLARTVLIGSQWLEIKQFLVKQPYRDQGYAKAMIRNLMETQRFVKITGVLSPILTHILLSYGWHREKDTYNYATWSDAQYPPMW